MKQLTFNEFSKLNAERCKTDFGRKVCAETAPIHALAACGEVGEMAQEMKRIMDKPGYPDVIAIKKLLFEAADAFTYLDLIASHFGFTFHEVLIEKFNIVSDRVGSKIKIPI